MLCRLGKPCTNTATFGPSREIVLFTVRFLNVGKDVQNHTARDRSIKSSKSLSETLYTGCFTQSLTGQVSLPLPLSLFSILPSSA